MKKVLSVILALAMLLAIGIAPAAAEDITLDVIIAQYGPNTQEWFLGNGMDGSNFVEKFEAANPGIKLNLEVVSWNDLYTVVSTKISNNNAPLLPGRTVQGFLPVLHRAVRDRRHLLGRSGPGFRPRAVLQRGRAEGSRR